MRITWNWSGSRGEGRVAPVPRPGRRLPGRTASASGQSRPLEHARRSLRRPPEPRPRPDPPRHQPNHAASHSSLALPGGDRRVPVRPGRRVATVVRKPSQDVSAGRSPPVHAAMSHRLPSAQTPARHGQKRRPRQTRSTSRCARRQLRETTCDANRRNPIGVSGRRTWDNVSTR